MHCITRSHLFDTIPEYIKTHFNLITLDPYEPHHLDYQRDATNFSVHIRAKQVFVWCGSNLGNLRTCWIYFEIAFCLHSEGSLIIQQKDLHNVELICQYLRIPITCENHNTTLLIDDEHEKLLIIKAIHAPYINKPLLHSFLIVLWIMYAGHISPIGHSSILRFKCRHHIALKREMDETFEKEWMDKVTKHSYPYQSIINDRMKQFINSAYSSDNEWDTKLWRHASHYNPWLTKGAFHNFQASRVIELVSLKGYNVQVRLFKNTYSRQKGPYVGLPEDIFITHLDTIHAKPDSVGNVDIHDLAHCLSSLDIGDGPGSSPPWPIDAISADSESGQRVIRVYLAWARHKGHDPLNQGIPASEILGCPDFEENESFTIEEEKSIHEEPQGHESGQELGPHAAIDVGSEIESDNVATSSKIDDLNVFFKDDISDLPGLKESIVRNKGPRIQTVLMNRDLFDWLSVTTIKLIDSSNMLKELSNLLDSTVTDAIPGSRCLYYWGTAPDECDLEPKLVLACTGILKINIPEVNYRYDELGTHGIETIKNQRFLLIKLFKMVSRSEDLNENEYLVKGVFPLITVLFSILVTIIGFVYMYTALVHRNVEFEDAIQSIITIIAFVLAPYFTVLHPTLYKKWSVLGSLSGVMSPRDCVSQAVFKCLAGKDSEITEISNLQRTRRLKGYYKLCDGQSFVGSVDFEGKILQFTYCIKDVSDLIQFGYDLRGTLYILTNTLHETWKRIQFDPNSGFYVSQTQTRLGNSDEGNENDSYKSMQFIRKFEPLGMIAEHRLK